MCSNIKAVMQLWAHTKLTNSNLSGGFELRIMYIISVPGRAALNKNQTARFPMPDFRKIIGERLCLSPIIPRRRGELHQMDERQGCCQ